MTIPANKEIVLKKIKGMPELRQIPFIFLSARADIEMKAEGIEEGADDYITKPFNSRELLARIKSHLRIRDLLNHARAQEKKWRRWNEAMFERAE